MYIHVQQAIRSKSLSTAVPWISVDKRYERKPLYNGVTRNLVLYYLKYKIRLQSNKILLIIIIIYKYKSKDDISETSKWLCSGKIELNINEYDCSGHMCSSKTINYCKNQKKTL